MLIRLSRKNPGQSAAPALAGNAALYLIVSAVPNFNRAMYQASRLANCQISLTQPFSPISPTSRRTFGSSRDQAQHFHLRNAARRRPSARRRFHEAYVHETSGMIINPNFYRDLKLERRAEMLKQGWIRTGPRAW